MRRVLMVDETISENDAATSLMLSRAEELGEYGPDMSKASSNSFGIVREQSFMMSIP
jgi:hypothetical protein